MGLSEPVQFIYFNGVLVCRSDAGLRWQCSCKTWNAWGRNNCCICGHPLADSAVSTIERDALAAGLAGDAA